MAQVTAPFLDSTAERAEPARLPTLQIYRGV